MVVIVRYSDLTVGFVRLALCKIVYYENIPPFTNDAKCIGLYYQNIQRFRKNPLKCLDLGGMVTFVVAVPVY